MKPACAFLAAIGLTVPALFAGCGYGSDTLESQARPDPAAVPQANGGAPAADRGDANAAGDGPAVPPPRREGTILDDRTAEIIDLAEAEAAGYRPSPGQEGVDAITQLGTVGVRTQSRVGSLSIQHWLNQHKGVEGRFPTYAELMQWMAETNVRLPGRYPYEKYAYDASTGRFLVVEHPESKAQYLKDRGVE